MAKPAAPSLTGANPMADVRAKFAAWWNGVEYKPGAPAPSLEAQKPAPAAGGASDLELFAPETPPRLEALQRLWGEERLFPGEAELQAAAFARLAMPATGSLAILGPGLAGPVRALAQAHPGEISVYEWRDEAVALLQAGVAGAGLSGRVKVQALDLETGHLPAEAYDGLLSFDEFTFCASAPRLALQIARALKPGASALLELDAGAMTVDLATCYASAFAEPQLQSAEHLQEALFEAGLRIEEAEDETQEHQALARRHLRRGPETLSFGPPMSPRALQEFAWEFESWGAKLKAYAMGQITRRRILALRR